MKLEPPAPTLRLLTLALMLLTAWTASARVTIQVYLGDLDVPAGTVGVLVADRNGDGFLPPDHVSVLGTALRAGERLGPSDDVILGALQASPAGFASGTGFAGTIAGLDYQSLQLVEGQKLEFFWFPGHQAIGETINEGDVYERFRSDAAGDAGEATAMLVPADGGVYTISYLNGPNGGTVDMRNPGSADSYAMGDAGLDRNHLTSDSAVDFPGGMPELPDVTAANYHAGFDGTYSGLVLGEGVQVFGNASIRLSRGGVSLSLDYRGQRLSFRGNLNAAGALTGTISRKGAPALALNLQLAQTDSGLRIRGGLIDGADQALIDTAFNPFGKSAPTPLAGAYTLLMPVDDAVDSSVSPGGRGAAAVSVGTDGRIGSTVILGDGSRLSLSGVLTGENEWFIYQSLYGGSGWLSGTALFRSTANVSSIDGGLTWTKGAELPGAKKKKGDPGNYPNGFATQVTLVGGSYRPPNRAAGERAINGLPGGVGNALLEFEKGGVNPAIPAIPLTWDAANNVQPVGLPPGVSLSLRVLVNNGLLSGVYSNANTGIAFSFDAAIFQQQDLAGGVFRYGAQTGNVLITPVGAPVLQITEIDGGILTDGDTLEFGDVGVDGGMVEKSVRVTNAGAGMLHVWQAPELSGDDSFFFATSRLGYISPGGSSVLTVRFDPDEVAAHAAAMTLITNDRTNNPVQIDLSGNGVAGSAGSGMAVIGDEVVVEPETPASQPGLIPVAWDPALHSAAFSGLIRMSDPEGRITGVGSLSLRADKKSGAGSVSGQLTVQGARLSLRGSFGVNGQFSGVVAVKNSEGFAILLQLAETDMGGQVVMGTMTGLVSGIVQDVLLERSVFNGKSIVATQAGTYTAVLPSNDDLGDGYPAGHGSGTVTVSTNGSFSMRGVLGDGERATVTGKLTDEGRVHLFTPIYRANPPGSLSGVLTFRDMPGISDFDGVVAWERPGIAGTNVYPDGFRMNVPLLGATFRTPNSSAGERAIAGLADGLANAELEFADGNLTPAIPIQTLTWQSNNTAGLTVPVAGEQLSMRVDVRNGSVSGQYVNLAVGHRIPFQGVVYQMQGMVAGSFQNGPITGSIMISPTGTVVMEVEDADGQKLNHGDTLELGAAGIEGGFIDRLIRIRNTGTGPLFIKPKSMLETASGQFGLVAGRAGYVPPGGSTAFRLRFRPGELGEDAAVLMLRTNDRTHAPFELRLSGQGEAVNTGYGLTQLESRLQQPLSAPLVPDTMPVAFNPGTHTGEFYGLIRKMGSIPAIPAGDAQVRVSFDSKRGQAGAGGRWVVDGNTLSLRGTFDAAGVFDGEVKGSYHVLEEMHLAEASSGHARIVGRLRDIRDGAEYEVRMGHLPYDRRNNPATELAGAYTVILPADESLGAGYPAGDSGGSLMLDEGGRIRGRMVLADGERVALQGLLRSGNRWMFWQELYGRGSGGKIGGVMEFRDVPDVSDFDGQLYWERPMVDRAGVYPFGFRLQTGVVGSTYVNQKGVSDLELNDLGEATLTLEGEGLSGSPQKEMEVQWDEGNRLLDPSSGSDTLRLTIDKTGILTGSYRDPDLGIGLSLGGAVFQKQNLVTGGYLSGGEADGYLQITPD